jgi:hypothetical protein
VLDEVVLDVIAAPLEVSGQALGTTKDEACVEPRVVMLGVLSPESNPVADRLLSARTTYETS